MRNNISHFQEGKQPLQYLSINLCPSERDLCYWHRVNGKIQPRFLPFYESIFLTLCAYELVANSSKKLLYNTRPYWYYGIIVQLNLGIVQRRALIGGTAVRFLHCTACCIMQGGVFITPQEAMEPRPNGAMIDYESSLHLKAVKIELSFPQQIVEEHEHVRNASRGLP